MARGGVQQVTYNGLVDLRFLREETEQQHNAVEGTLPLTDPKLDRDRYGHILQCFYSVVHPWESWALRHAPPGLTGMVNERQRSPLLLRDLQHFGLSPAPEPEGGARLATVLAGREKSPAEYEAAFLGVMYVMEGSTLGGQYIARHVEEVLRLTPGEGDAYFRGYGEQTGSMWNAFRELLGAVPDEHSPAVIAAARATFAYVEDRLRDCPAAVGSSGGRNVQSDASDTP